MHVNREHRLDQATWMPSPHCDERPGWAAVDLVVVHCVSLPEGEFGTGAPTRLFLGDLDPDEHPSFADLEGLQVAPHLLILRDGAVQQFVSFDKRAWHAGVSEWCGRITANDFSIGIELEGAVDQPYEKAQYVALRQVLRALCETYEGVSPEAIVGHAEIAPDRKEDPGPHFDWASVLKDLYGGGDGTRFATRTPSDGAP